MIDTIKPAASPAIPPDTRTAIKIILDWSTPTAIAPSRLSAAANIALPSRAYLKNAKIAAVQMITVMKSTSFW